MSIVSLEANVLARRANQVIKLGTANVPETPIAVQLHEQNWRQLTRESFFGSDPVACYTQLSVLRERDFTARHPPNMEDIMQYVLRGNFHPFKLAITDFIQLTKSYGRVIGY